MFKQITHGQGPTLDQSLYSEWANYVPTSVYIYLLEQNTVRDRCSLYKLLIIQPACLRLTP